MMKQSRRIIESTFTSFDAVIAFERTLVLQPTHRSILLKSEKLVETSKPSLNFAVVSGRLLTTL